MITDSFGPEIEEAYEIPSDEWKRLTVYEVRQMQSELYRAITGLPQDEKPSFKKRLRDMLTVAECQRVGDLIYASDLSQKCFMAVYPTLMGWK